VPAKPQRVRAGLAELVERAGPFGVAGAGQPDAVAACIRQALVVRQPGQPGPPAAERPLERGAAGRAILAARSSEPGAFPDLNPLYLVTEGELQAGACGVAAPLLGVPGVEASVGVVALGRLDAATVGPRVLIAASEIAAALR
jgi:DNA-binding IclR family transcriptional regulator